MSRFLEGLNDRQKEAVEYTKGPLLILAGAGSGKTRVLTYKIAYLIDEKIVKPWEILSITFTKKAANEMKERALELHEDAKDVWLGTFHSICNRILRTEIEVLEGYNRDFTIFDEQDKQRLIKDIYKKLNIDDKEIAINYTIKEISKAKNKLQDAKSYASEVLGDFRKDKIAEIYFIYEKEMRKYNSIDFDDILMLTVKILLENESVLNKYRNKFKYILVDEYQDTNNIQFQFITLLGNHGNVSVVGDESQSIYGFRGADISNILNFEKEFKQSKTIKLEENYRSTNHILDAANKVILNNKNKIDKNLWTSKKDGEKITFFETRNEYSEVEFVVDEIDRLCREKRLTYEDFAVLFRTNAQARVIEEVFMKKGTPYRLIGGLKFYSRKEIKDITSYLKLIKNTNDNVSLKRIINVPKRGIGNAAVEKLEAIADSNNISIYDAILSEELYSDVRSRNNIIAFKEVIEELRSLLNEVSISELIKTILVKSGYEDMLNNENKKEAENRFENLMEFIGVAIEFEKENADSNLTDFLESIALVSDVDNIVEGSSLVTLMTMHNSKGLEYNVVFLVGMEEDLFPSGLSKMEDENVEEERRLFYVGITRAKEKLYLTNTTQRTLYGQTKFMMRSRFIDEIPKECYDDNFKSDIKIEKVVEPKRINTTSSNKSKFGIDVNKFFKNMSSATNLNKDKDLSVYEIGVKVRHKKFGVGIITNVAPENDDLKLEINFESAGFKRLMAKYAILDII